MSNVPTAKTGPDLPAGKKVAQKVTELKHMQIIRIGVEVFKVFRISRDRVTLKKLN
jgi:hypothetical protein